MPKTTLEQILEAARVEGDRCKRADVADREAIAEAFYKRFTEHFVEILEKKDNTLIELTASQNITGNQTLLFQEIKKLLDKKLDKDKMIKQSSTSGFNSTWIADFNDIIQKMPPPIPDSAPNASTRQFFTGQPNISANPHPPGQMGGYRKK
jgi:hypothetical protein